VTQGQTHMMSVQMTSTISGARIGLDKRRLRVNCQGSLCGFGEDPQGTHHRARPGEMAGTSPAMTRHTSRL
jgi:hypothetical protein